MTKKIEYAMELLDKLVSKSGDLDWKVEEIEGDVDTLKCGFDSLKQDVTVLESARSELSTQSKEIGTCLKEHSKQTGADLLQIQTSVNNTKSTVNTLEGFLHPCGGSGWHRAVYRDFRDITTDCPMEWDTQTDLPEKPYTCGRKSGNGTCDATSFPVGVEYSKVCGRIKAYQVGVPNAFHSLIVASINERYLDGISLTHGGTLGNTAGVDATHIWSFSSGTTDSNDTLQPRAVCPCNNDPGAAPPSFVGKDYFCESAQEGDITFTDDVTSLYGQFFDNDPLWDGKGCSDPASDCCSRVDGPYFIKQLEEKTTDAIDVRICGLRPITATDYAVELIEIYVQ